MLLDCLREGKKKCVLTNIINIHLQIVWEHNYQLWLNYKSKVVFSYVSISKKAKQYKTTCLINVKFHKKSIYFIQNRVLLKVYFYLNCYPIINTIKPQNGCYSEVTSWLNNTLGHMITMLLYKIKTI